MLIQQGKRLGNYSVLRLIGQGGFANVYLGQHIYLNTYAAIKVLQMQMTQDDFANFKVEAQTINNLTHPRIMRVLEFGKEEELPFLVMDYCPDGTLRKRHPKGTCLSLSECVGYTKQIAEALQYAQSMKVIHRDIKPENMLIGKDGTILLSDFGIAIAAQSSRYQMGQNVGGTLAYMAPEQFEGKATFASDQYALGVVVYEWLSGETPFKGSPMEIIAQQFKGQPTPLQVKVANLPPAVEQVVLKALARDPQQRFQSVQEFAIALEQASQGKMPTALNATYDTVSSSASLNEELIPTYRKELDQNPGIHSDGDKPAPHTLPSDPFVLARTTDTSPPNSVRYSPQQPKKSKTGVYVAVIVALVIALLGTSTLALMGMGLKVGPLPNPLDNRVPGGTYTKNVWLTCESCVDPIGVMITTISVDSAIGRMEWNLSLYNNTKNAYNHSDFYFSDFSLRAAKDPKGVLASGGIVGETGPEDLPAEQKITTKCFFPFRPLKDVTYTLHATLHAYLQGDINFDPVNMKFP